MKKSLFFLCTLCCLFSATMLKAQQDGNLDPSFGSNGILTITNISNVANSDLKSVVLQPDGKILLGGYAKAGIPQIERFFVSRILPADGSVDPNFNSGAHKVFSDSSNAIGVMLALANDGSIYYGGGRGPNYYGTMGKIGSSGADIFGPVTPVNSGSSYTHKITGLSYNSNTNSIFLSGSISVTSSYMLGYKFTTVGTLDQSFNGTGKFNFFVSPMQNYTLAKAVINMDDGSVLLGGSTPSNNAITIVKLKSDGTFDSSFGTNGVFTISGSVGGTTGNIEAMTLLPGGKIMVCGMLNGDFVIYRINANGTQDVTFNAVPITYTGNSNDALTSMLIQPDGKIIASGYSLYGTSGMTGMVCRYKLNGEMDSTFGTSGIEYISGFYPNASALSVSEKAAYLVGKNSYPNGQMCVAKINYNNQKFNILGKDIVSIETQNSFTMHPQVASYTYNWSYSDPNVYTLGSSTKDTVTLYFTKTTSSGTLTCVVKNALGVVVKTATKYIAVNQQPTLAQQLTATNCDPAQTYDADAYINSFNIRQKLVGSTDADASATGYSDLTASNYDTLYLGDHYQANIKCVRDNTDPIYTGLWIDLNNDGDMGSSNEFLGSSVSDDSVFTVNNIAIPLDASAGPKRMRVRIRQSSSFSPSEYCQVNEESSETVDYLVVLGTYQGILTPNFITPNNDGKNDQFVVHGVQDGLNNSLKIFNRIGDLVYDVSNYDNSWAGQDKSGGMLKPGTYYFVFTQKSTTKSDDDVVKGFFEIRY